MRSQLVDAFEESLALAPEPAEVLAGMRAGIERRRSRQRRYRAGGVLAAVVLALFASMLTVAAVREEPVSQPAAGGGQIPVGNWTSTLQVGWVPEGLRPLFVESTGLGEEVLYKRTAPAICGSASPRPTGRRRLTSPAGNEPRSMAVRRCRSRGP